IIWEIVPYAFIGCNILSVHFLVCIENASSEFLLLYDLCAHHTVKSVFPNASNLICNPDDSR
ncbi:hypothetical protein, partial [Klebsiella pneumoniae]|uniref:hypothetical protein n=1 Tax=Klebsiella pneumoniae TaxID=573 RepID=UPI00358FA9DB